MIIARRVLSILAICCLFSTIGVVSPKITITEAEDAYRAIPVQYDSSHGVIEFAFDFTPFDFKKSSQDIIIEITVYDKANNAHKVFKNIGLRAEKMKDYSENIGFNVTAIQITSPVGNSPRWNISSELLSGETATAQPKTRKIFYVVTRYVGCKGGGVCAKTVTVDADTYKAIKDKRDIYKIDDVRNVLLSTSYETVFRD
jgi:hypothetical protein